MANSNKVAHGMSSVREMGRRAAAHAAAAARPKYNIGQKVKYVDYIDNAHPVREGTIMRRKFLVRGEGNDSRANELDYKGAAEFIYELELPNGRRADRWEHVIDQGMSRGGRRKTRRSRKGARKTQRRRTHHRRR